MRVEHVVIFKFDELPETGQHKAHERYLTDGHEVNWADENRQSMEEFCKVFPVRAGDWSYSSAGSYVTPEMDYGRYHEAVWELTGLRLRTWLVNNFEQWLYAGKFICTVLDGKHKSKHSKALIEESSCPFTGYCMDDDLLDPIRAFIKKPDGRFLEDLLREALESWVKACEKECEYEESFEYFAEMAQANGWEFYANGRMA